MYSSPIASSVFRMLLFSFFSLKENLPKHNLLLKCWNTIGHFKWGRGHSRLFQPRLDPSSFAPPTHSIGHLSSPENANSQTLSVYPHLSLPLSLELRSPAADMATVLESIVVPRSSALPSGTLSPIAASSVSSFAGRVGLPHYTGLKIRSTHQTRSIGSLIYARRRGGLVVCEAQNTAVEGQLRYLSSCFPFCLEFWILFTCCVLYLEIKLNRLVYLYDRSFLFSFFATKRWFMLLIIISPFYVWHWSKFGIDG